MTTEVSALSNKTKQRNIGIDITKFLMSFLVVCIHVPFPGEFGQYFVVICRIAVPIFFMISGFFYDGMMFPQRANKRITRMFLIAIGCELFYCLFNLSIQFISPNGSPVEFLLKSINIQNLIRFVIFNRSLYTPHSWYLFAIVYVLVFFRLVDKVFSKNKRILYCTIISVLIVINLMLVNYSYTIFGKMTSEYIARNWFFTGVPFFALGRIIRENTRRQPSKCEVDVSIVISTVMILLSLIEVYLLKKTGSYNPNSCLSLFTVGAAIAVFYIAIHVKLSSRNCLVKLLGGGRNIAYSYIFSIIVS